MCVCVCLNRYGYCHLLRPGGLGYWNRDKLWLDGDAATSMQPLASDTQDRAYKCKWRGARPIVTHWRQHTAGICRIDSQTVTCAKNNARQLVIYSRFCACDRAGGGDGGGISIERVRRDPLNVNVEGNRIYGCQLHELFRC